jgi:uncharacterized cupin superfamily protein
MRLPDGGGPPPSPSRRREEMFAVLEGEIEIAFGGERWTARSGDTVDVRASLGFSRRLSATACACCVSPRIGSHFLVKEKGLI